MMQYYFMKPEDRKPVKASQTPASPSNYRKRGSWACMGSIRDLGFRLRGICLGFHQSSFFVVEGEEV